jgi:hypothetical protein
MFLGNINAIIFFILLGYITTFFSKNMIIVLLVPLLFTNFFMAGMKIKEGLESMAKEESDEKKPTLPTKPDVQNKDNEHEIINMPHTQEAPIDEQFEGRRPLEYGDFKKKGKNSGARLDHGATVENAYDTLNKIIGGPGFSKMTDDTKRLMEQQQKLAQSMEQFGPMLDSIKPFLEKAQGLLGKMDIKGISDMANQTKV